MDRFRIWSQTSEFQDLESVGPKPLAALLEYWRECKADRLVPRQKDMDISKFPPCLPNIALIDLAPAATESKYLIVGGALRRLLGEDPTGKTIRETYSKEYAEEVGGALMKVAGEKAPSYYIREFQILTMSFGYRRLLLPISLKDHNVARVLVGIYPINSEFKDAAQWKNAVKKMKDQQGTDDAFARAWLDSIDDGKKSEKDDDAGEPLTQIGMPKDDPWEIDPTKKSGF